MSRYNLAEAKTNLSALVERAAGGEVIEISKRGRPLVKLVAIEKPRQPLDVEAFTALTGKMRPSKVTSVQILREMRDSRY